MSQAKRFQGLDVLRGFAAMSVLLYHYTYIYGLRFGYHDQLLFKVPLGRIGVQVFFMISGYVIFMTLERTHRGLDFAVSRLSRLYPAYWAAMLMTTMAVYFSGIPQLQVTIKDFFGNLIMLPIGFEMVDTVYWTLIVELFFYFVMLLLFYGRLLNNIKTVLLVWVVMSILFPLLERQYELTRFIIYRKFQAIFIFDYVQLFGLGIILYLRRKSGRFNKLDFAIITICLLKQFLVDTYVVGLLILSFVIYIYLLVINRLTRLNIKPLIFLGTISYPLYLIHRKIGFALIWHLQNSGLNIHLAILVTTICILVLATILTFAIEQPVMKGIRRWWRERSALRTAALREA